MYRIGIVEDSGDEIDKIERTLDFFYTDFDMSYYFSDRTYTPENIVGNLSNDIIMDIQSDKIDGLIIDYKVMLDDIIIEGNEIYREINMVIPKFPIIILTEIVDEPEGKEYIENQLFSILKVEHLKICILSFLRIWIIIEKIDSNIRMS